MWADSEWASRVCLLHCSNMGRCLSEVTLLAHSALCAPSDKPDVCLVTVSSAADQMFMHVLYSSPSYPTLLLPLPFLFLSQMDRMSFLSFLLLCLTSVANGNKGQFLIRFTVNCVKMLRLMVYHGSELTCLMNGHGCCVLKCPFLRSVTRVIVTHTPASSLHKWHKSDIYVWTVFSVLLCACACTVTLRRW